jgi:hypothetical protein
MAAQLLTPPTGSAAARVFGLAVPIAVLGDLIGLGGAEFRLPVLADPLGYSVRQAVPLNLAVSLATIAASLAMWTLQWTTDLHSPFRPRSSVKQIFSGGQSLLSQHSYGQPQMPTWQIARKVPLLVSPHLFW